MEVIAISKKGLASSFELILNLINLIESDKIYYSKFVGEPFLTKYNLKRSLSGAKFLDSETENIINILAYSDGKRGLIEISKILNENFFKLKNLADKIYVGSMLHSSPYKHEANISSGIITGPRRQINLSMKYLF